MGYIMKTYENVPLKRYIQRILWKHIPIKTKRILALSSPNFEWEYLRVLPGRCISDKNITFVNFEFSDDFYWSKTVKNSLIGAFDMMVHENKPPFFIDADFCKSIKNVILFHIDCLFVVINKIVQTKQRAEILNLGIVLLPIF